MSDSDPRNQPGYQAEYDPNDQRDIGHGKELGADLQALYLAGRTHLPELAQQFVTMSDSAHDHRGRVQYLADSVQTPAAMGHAMSLVDELAVALYRTSVALRDSGQALVEISTDYAGTDEAACKEFNRLNRLAAGDLAAPTPGVSDPVPPSEPSEPYVPPEPPSLLDQLKDLGGDIAGGVGDWWHDLNDPDPGPGPGSAGGVGSDSGSGADDSWGDDLTPSAGGSR